jgi:hypothetical protein
MHVNENMDIDGEGHKENLAPELESLAIDSEAGTKVNYDTKSAMVVDIVPLQKIQVPAKAAAPALSENNNRYFAANLKSEQKKGENPSFKFLDLLRRENPEEDKFFQLPTDYNLILKLFQALDQQLKYCRNRQIQTTFNNIKPTIQSFTGRDFTIDRLR